MRKSNYFGICAFIFELVLNFSKGNQFLDKNIGIDGIVWETSCRTIQNTLSEIQCLPIGLPGNSNEGFFTQCDIDFSTCTITYKNPQSFTPSSISIKGIIYGIGDAKITVSTSQSKDFLVIDNTLENWGEVEKDIPVADIEPNMKISIRLENLYWDLYVAIIDSIEIKGDFGQNPPTTTGSSGGSTSQVTDTTTTSSGTYQPTDTTTTTIRSSTNQPTDTTTTSSGTNQPTDTTTTTTTIRSSTNQPTDTTTTSSSTNQPIQTTFQPDQTTTFNPIYTTDHYHSNPSTNQPDRTTYPQYSTTTYPVTHPTTTDGPDWGLCKPKTWTTSSTWTDVDDSFFCPKMIKIVTKTLITTTILQRE